MAKTPKKIDLTLMDDDLKTMIESAIKVHPVNTYADLPNPNVNNWDYARVLSGAEKNNIYVWNNTLSAWELIGADDKTVPWDEITGKPTEFPPEVHTHNYSPIVHTHTESEITDLDKYSQAEVDTLLTGKAAAVHNHDDLYFTEAEITALLADKAATTHSHDDLYFTEAEVTALLAGKAAADHNHDGRYYSITQIDNFLTNKSDIGHNHDGTYAIKAVEATVSDHETRLDAIEGGYTTGHSHVNLTDLNNVTSELINHPSDTVAHVTQIDKDNWNSKASGTHTHVKTDITDLGSLDFIPTSEKGIANGVATLGVDGLVPASQLPVINNGVYWNDVLNKPSEFTPSAHKTLHASGGADALTPADIGALPSSTYTASDILAKLKTVAGSGSGLDTDLLDGLQGSEYARFGSYYTADLNNLATPGIWNCNDTCSNKPEDNWGSVYVSFIAHNLWIQQLWIGQFGKMYVRYSSDNANARLWQPWVELYHSGNITRGTAAPSGGSDGDIYFKYT